MKRLSLIVILLAVWLSACTTKHHHDVDFYYWKSKCAIGETERDYFNQLESKRLFVRLFDVEINDGVAVPVGQIQGFDKGQLPNDHAVVIPVVFITNETFLACTDDESIGRLAKNVGNGVSHFMETATGPNAHASLISGSCNGWPTARNAASAARCASTRSATAPRPACRLSAGAA